MSHELRNCPVKNNHKLTCAFTIVTTVTLAAIRVILQEMLQQVQLEGKGTKDLYDLYLYVLVGGLVPLP